MKRLFFILLALPVVIVVVLLLTRMRWKFSKPATPPVVPQEIAASNAAVTTRSAQVGAPSGQAARLLGETILRGYADTNLPPENDLTLMSRLMENSLLLLKSAANRPLSANEDLADLFRGKNGAREEFLPAQHVALNDKGQLIDRWQTPLFFHALGGGRYEIRSAGPDQQMWTEDDIQRNANGTFLREKNGISEPGR
jgi:hypothetical protein